MADRLHGSAWLVGLLAFAAGAIVSAILPALAPVLAGALLIAGLVGYRQTASPKQRQVALALLVSGFGLLILILVGSMGIATSESVLERTGTPVP